MGAARLHARGARPASVVGLVGPNGAGKTTLLEMVIGLLEPTEGQVSVFGEASRADTAATLARVGYVAQDHPLYRGFSVADMFHFGRAMNPELGSGAGRRRGWTRSASRCKRKVKELSGGQQAQVSLTMALAKRAPLLVLDEPVSSLDPIARLEFMRDVMAAAADTGLTVIISSHVVSELERLCDWLIVLAAGTCSSPGRPTTCSTRTGCSPSRARPRTPSCPGTVIHRGDSDRHSTVLVRTDPGQLAVQGHAGWQADPVGFEQLVMAYLRRSPVGSSAVRRRSTGRSRARGTRRTPRGRSGRETGRTGGEGGRDPMIWVTWRQHRSQAIVCLGRVLAPRDLRDRGRHLDAQRVRRRRDWRVPGAQRGVWLPGGDHLLRAQVQRLAAITATLPLFVIPGLVGVVVGAPLIGRELE